MQQRTRLLPRTIARPVAAQSRPRAILRPPTPRLRLKTPDTAPRVKELPCGVAIATSRAVGTRLDVIAHYSGRAAALERARAESRGCAEVWLVQDEKGAWLVLNPVLGGLPRTSSKF